jgi:hypothetical protein
MADLEARALTRTALPLQPWADSYWPMYKGIIGNRYADRSAPHAKTWLANHSHVISFPASSIIATGDQSRINALSPAEKYDYVVGDPTFSLTRFVWNQGASHYNRTGVVASWMGICHGWAAAAHMLVPVPEKPVAVPAPNGTPVTFYPQDVKALQSMLWANGNPKTRYLGWRCDVSRPPRNSYGRIMEYKCYDVNPGTWHIAATNQMGIHQRSMVFDATYDAEVWNFPLVGYQYRYFNPQTWEEGRTLRAAMVPIEKYRVDKFKQFRAPGTRYVVGVYMDVNHVGAINPTRASVKAPIKTIRLIYDLELDANLNIVGGEWYSNAHPDFIWTFDKGAQASSHRDENIANDVWTLATPVPSHWGEIARSASARGTPLFHFVRRLAESSAPINETEGEEPEQPETFWRPISTPIESYD